MKPKLLEEYLNKLPVVADEIIKRYKANKSSIIVSENQDGTKNVRVYDKKI